MNHNCPNPSNCLCFEKSSASLKITKTFSKEEKAQIDAEAKKRSSRQPQSLLQRYDNLPKRSGFVNARSFLI